MSEATRRLNPQLAAGRPLAEVLATAKDALDSVAPPQAKRIRQDGKPLLNKLEGEFLAELSRFHPGATVWKQALRWRLGNGIWYKPDFAAFVDYYLSPGLPAKVRRLCCWEVKGPHAFRGGFENLKVAAGLYPNVRWSLVWKDGGRWQEQEVLP